MSKQTKVKKFVFERTKAEAWVILDLDGKHVANVQSISTENTTTVDVWHCLARHPEPLPMMQQGKASGYGYNRFSAALAGLVIDGHTMYDSCHETAQTRALLKEYQESEPYNPRDRSFQPWDDKAASIGARFANRYTSLYMFSGLNLLTAKGYTVIRAL